MDYEKDIIMHKGHKSEVERLKSKCDALQERLDTQTHNLDVFNKDWIALQAELLDARTRLDEQRIMTDELKAENERLTNQLDGKYQIMEKQLAIIKERDTELQSLRDEVDNAPSGTVKENNGSLVVFGEYEHASDPELCLKPHRRYKMVEIKGGN